jgi:predicted RNA binding protein YcfA (HicA-like mRNA interferase family)
MKRIDLIRHLERHGVQFLREGRSHSVYVNRESDKYLPPHYAGTGMFVTASVSSKLAR